MELKPLIELSGETGIIHLSVRKPENKREVIVNVELMPELQKRKWNLMKNGRFLKNEYATCYQIKVGKQTTLLMHRVIASIVYGIDIYELPDIDHEDHNGLNNTLSNLRLASITQNNGNQRISIRPTKTSQFKGVSWYKAYGCWSAQIQENKKPTHLGYFNCEVEAAKAYNQAASEIFGEYAYLNPIPDMPIAL